MQQIQLTDDQKFQVLLSQLQERYCAAHNMRERSTRFALWISGMAIGLAWLLISQPAMSLMQRIALTLLIAALSTGSFVFMNALSRGFKNNRAAMIECERSLQMHETGTYVAGCSLLPAAYAENSRRWSDHFSTLIVWMSIVSLAPIILTWTCPHKTVADKQAVQIQERKEQWTNGRSS